jgi:hypothetical protein
MKTRDYACFDLGFWNELARVLCMGFAAARETYFVLAYRALPYLRPV